MADTIPEVLQAFARGELVVVTDDDDREGEGDLIVAASLCTAEKMAFIIRHTSGIVCAPITTNDARRLRLDPMVAHNDSAHTTAFTVSITTSPTAAPVSRPMNAPPAAARWPTLTPVPTTSPARATSSP
jgi:3,4-dihydroxy 2-butanone 4-phosphate synthase/GTP cyclohydrolase II